MEKKTRSEVIEELKDTNVWKLKGPK